MLRLTVLLIAILTSAVIVSCVDKFSREDFPPGFTFGAGTSAYQVEGAANEDGRTPSVWDTFTHMGFMNGGETGDVTADEYHKYKEDVQLMVETGLDAYRFSISWSRLIPNGRGAVNPKGVEYYNNLINELVSHGIQPHVTLFQFDHPQSLEDEYGGWISKKIVKDFTAFAEVCFREFGDRVRYWTTLNEPNILVLAGYDAGILPPKRCSPPFGVNCTKGNSSTEPYLVAHNIVMAHATVARLYRKKYQTEQLGSVGINAFVPGLVPLTNSTEDKIATERFFDFFVGLIVHPLVFGDYPETVKKIVGTRLPAFTNDESKLLKGSIDFLGINHYVTFYIKNNPNSLKLEHRDFSADMAATSIVKLENSSTFQFPINPWGLKQVLEYFKQVYGNPPIYIHENGQTTPHNSSLEDVSRMNYIQAYIGGLLDSVRNGSNARGYFVWSFIDVFELLNGYQARYGLYYVDFDDSDLRRYPKLSAHWYSDFLKGGIVSSGADIESINNPSTSREDFLRYAAI